MTPQTFAETVAEVFALRLGEQPRAVVQWSERSECGTLYLATARTGRARGVAASYFIPASGICCPVEVKVWRGLRRNGDHRVQWLGDLGSLLRPDLDATFGED